MSAIHGRDDGELKKYRTEIPNVVFTLGLDPYALALYCHFKRTTGAADGGLCYKSTRTLAKESGMSAGRVSAARAELEKPRQELEGKSLIRVERPKDRSKSINVVCIDIWPENFGQFSECSPHEQSVHHMNAECSPHERKKEPFKKEPFKNSRRGAQQAESPPRIDLIKVLVDDLEILDIYLSKDDKERYAGQVAQLRKKGVSDKRIVRAIKRAVADWDKYPHTSLQKALAFAEGTKPSAEGRSSRRKDSIAVIGAKPEDYSKEAFGGW